MILTDVKRVEYPLTSTDLCTLKKTFFMVRWEFPIDNWDGDFKVCTCITVTINILLCVRPVNHCFKSYEIVDVS